MAELPDDTALHVQSPPPRSLADCSGLDSVTAQLDEAVVTPATDDRLATFGASGVLLHGPAGVGKTRVAHGLLGELGFTYVELTPADLELDRPDAAAATIDRFDDLLAEQEPCALLIDDLDVLAPGVDDGRSEQVVTELCNLLDELDESNRDVLFVATTTELSRLDERVRRAGRIDLTIGIERPDFHRRCAILRDEFAALSGTDVEVAVDDEDVEVLAGWTDGFSAAEIAEVVERAARKCGDSDIDMECLGDAVDELHDVDDFRSPPSDRAEDASEDPTEDIGPRGGEDPEGVTGRGEDRGTIVEGASVPDVTFGDVGGLDGTEQRLREVVEWPRKYPEKFEALDVDTAKGILLYGPPGTGKTLLAKAIATETDSTFIAVDGPELLDRYVGESERFVRKLFETAQEEAPSVVFLDEIDAIAGSRGGYTGGGGVQDSIVNQFLSELDGLTGLEDVVVIGATNRIEVIDPALTRPGRLGEAIHVPPPDEAGRREVFEIHTANRRLADDVDVDWLVERTSAAYTGADVEELCERAAMNAIRDAVEGETDESVITQDHFERAIAALEPSGATDADAGDNRAFR